MIYKTSYELSAWYGGALSYGSYVIANSKQEALDILEWRDLGEEIITSISNKEYGLVDYSTYDWNDSINQKLIYHQSTFLASTVSKHNDYSKWCKAAFSDIGLLHEMLHCLTIDRHVIICKSYVLEQYKQLINMSRGYF